MKKILGLDLGTNSIGWALVDAENNKIDGMGSRIIPMSQDVLGKFDSGVSISQTAERTGYRGVRRLRERCLLRRERLHRVLNILGFLPKHYRESIDFEMRFGQFVKDSEPKLAWKEIAPKKYDFIFKASFNEMVAEFKKLKPELFELKENGVERKIPYDWTIYYLRKKALTEKIEKEELAWLILNFNQKRGYYQLRGEEQEENKNKQEKFHTLLVTDVVEREKGKSGTWYNVVLENGWIYKRESKVSLSNWIGKTRDFIVTTELNDDGSVKLNKDNEEKRSFRSPKEEDWGLVKIRTEQTINQSGKTVGEYIYDSLLENPTQKINGKLVRTIERKFYKEELKAILEKQKEFHAELQNTELYTLCLKELYKNNESHRNSIATKDCTYLFLEDILFYQRPLKSKKSLIANCQFESVKYKGKDKEGNDIEIRQPLKCIAKSHPLFQEFRLWQFIQNLKIYERERMVDGKLKLDVDVTSEFLKTEDDNVALFDWLNDRKDIKQDTLLTSYFKIKKNRGEDKLPYRWNYVEDKEYPCNETRSLFLSKSAKIEGFDATFFNEANTEALWHILYSVTDKIEIQSAINKFAGKHDLPDEFIKQFANLPPYKSDYGSYSAKAIKKILPLMRMGKYWDDKNIDDKTKERIDKIIDGEFDEKIKDRVRDKAINLTDINHFRGLPLWLASYIVYNRHSEAKDIVKWETVKDLAWFLDNRNPEGFKQHSLRNPIVEQVITETLRTVKDIWQQYGNGAENFFDEIHVELGREMKNPADKRKAMTEQINANENTNLRIKAILEELKNAGISDVRPFSPTQQEILKIYEEGIYSYESKKEELEVIDKIRKSSKPTKSEIQRYKLWLEQGYISPYTGAMIKLSDLFTTRYEIEHIFPQSRFFDDSLSNKVICESEVNSLKGNQTAMEFIKKHHGQIVPLKGGTDVRIRDVLDYEDYVKRYFSKNKTKQRNLLSEEIPEGFINRQMNDSRYIAKVVKTYLSNIVRQTEKGELEQEATSKKVVSVTGSITSQMKQDWGLNDVWNHLITPRFERLNTLTNSSAFGQWELKGGKNGGEGKRAFQTTVPVEIAKGFSKKRIDHRHHALDALVIACITREHINYLNSINSERKNYSLVSKLRRLEEVMIKDQLRKVPKEFHKPWENFTQDAQAALENIIVSFKQNLRVINKSVNKYQRYENGEKVFAKQTKGDSWAVRKPLHAETVSGKVILGRIVEKEVAINRVLEDLDSIVDPIIKKELKNRATCYKNNIAGLKKYLKVNPIIIDGQEVVKVNIYVTESIEATATRKILDTTFDEKRIEKITDTGIQKILMKHLNQDIYQNATDEAGKKIPSHELAFSEEGLEALHKNMLTLNNGKPHQPIKKVRVFEEGRKFALGTRGNKKDKYVEAAKGTNLFFAIYIDQDGKRSYETIPLNEVIERQKQGLDVAQSTEGKTLLFTLSPNDLVYVPTDDEVENPHWVDFRKLTKEQVSRVYKMVSSTAYQCFFTPYYIATPIIQTVELGANNKSERTWNGSMIKEVGVKINVDRLGKVN
ncbi:CRISPR-associated endonuclease Csn1 [Dysgonomonas alginatilytica]|uniref:CRISPR-associated endonuclease Cas9 n=1 Tax=Dysgonomonas alginatilytica TaxID=1605892 RepID=A0A2V3PME4_9BACT|nr:type II CRISPR RNA-guided endonuclease Cas9 [Dysgonomonas alginatilytica]PXV61124.1 CRISPR-associated endonuclease Csn1 [Dysgonomonas alginatilytica]